MEASAGALRRLPSISGAGTGTGANPFQQNSCCSNYSSKPSMLCFSSKELWSNSKSRKIIGSRFYDEGHLEYYCSVKGRIRCGKEHRNKNEDNKTLKETKKRNKLLKGLSKDLNVFTNMGFGFGPDVALADQVQGRTISEAAELLLGQLQKLKEELNRRRKEEKALMKMEMKRLRNGESSSSSSSSESSESSDDECENLVDMKNMKCQSLAQSIPQACERALDNAMSNAGIPTIENNTIEIEAQTISPEVDASAVIPSTASTSTVDSVERTANTEVQVLCSEQKQECSMGASVCCSGNVASSTTLGSSNATIAAEMTTSGTKKIEVCMGGKCKKSGAAAILEEFQRVVGIEAAVSGCKCMGKCKVGPNIRVWGSSSDGIAGLEAVDSVSVTAAPASNNAVCVGVGLEDVSPIAANFLGIYQEVGLANALP